jgi:hypothetical protein
MPTILYKFYSDYPKDFELINAEFIALLAEQNKPIIISIPFSDVSILSTTYWEAVILLIKQYHYILNENMGPFGYDILTPPGY